MTVWSARTKALEKEGSRVQSPVVTENKKGKTLLVVNIEILQCGARGVPRISLSLQGKDQRAEDKYFVSDPPNNWTTRSRD